LPEAVFLADNAGTRQPRSTDLGMLTDTFKMMRPHQWVKNLFIFPALLFSKHLFHLPSLLTSIAAFAIFCLLSGAVYIFNDIMDVEEDRHHPLKKTRPVAAGRMTKYSAGIIFGLMSVTSLALSFAVNTGFGIIASVYFIINVCYSTYLKRIAIVDVMVVSLGFVLRAAAGGVAISVRVSSWLLVCTILIALFLTLAKRRHELTLLAERSNLPPGLSIAADDSGGAIKYRKTLDEYSAYFLDQMIAVTTASTLMAYILYTLSGDAAIQFGQHLIYTVPFVIYGIFRYLYLIHQKREGGSPTTTLLGDRPLLVDIALWVVAVVTVIYF
jgi:4-hydroxybenzoate polyprenyltransferase